MDIYKKYGLTKEIAAAKGIRPLEYVAIESPEFAKEASFIPEEVSDLIEKQELVWALSIEATYGQRRRWNEFLAVRELLQNSLDAEHEAVGYDRIAVKIEEGRFGTWIKDRGKGITYKAFMLGGEEKPCEMRGAYGEGLKIGLIWFTALSGAHYKIYFSTRGGVVFTCYYSKLADALVIVFGKSKRPVAGTHVFLRRYFMPKEMYEAIYYKAAKLKTVCKESYATRNCPVEMPNLVLYPGGLLYVRDIYVNEIKEMIGKPAWFSYNLWWVELEPNRVMVNSAWNLSREVGQALGACPGITSMMEDCLREEEYGGMKYYMLEDKYYETRVDYAVTTPKVRDAVKRLLKNYKITAYSGYGDFDGVGAVAHEGGICLLVPEAMFPLFRELPKASEFVMKSLRTMVKGAIPVDERTFDAYVRGRLQVWRLWRDDITEAKIEVIKGERSFYRPEINTIFMCETDLAYYNDESFIHELSHAHGTKRYGTAPDLTENFEKALAEVGRDISIFLTNRANMAAVERCISGCVHATPKTTDAFFGDLKPKLTEIQISELIHSPLMFVIVYKSPITEVERVCLSSPTLAHKPVVEDTYDKYVKERLKALITIRDKYLRREMDMEEVIKRLDTAKLSTRLGEILDAESLYLYVYNMRSDKYTWLETVK